MVVKDDLGWDWGSAKWAESTMLASACFGAIVLSQRCCPRFPIAMLLFMVGLAIAGARVATIGAPFNAYPALPWTWALRDATAAAFDIADIRDVGALMLRLLALAPRPSPHELFDDVALPAALLATFLREEQGVPACDEAAASGGSDRLASWSRWNPRATCRIEVPQLIRRAASRALCTVGSSKPIKTAMIAITTRSSTSVKPWRSRRQALSVTVTSLAVASWRTILVSRWLAAQSRTETSRRRRHPFTFQDQTCTRVRGPSPSP
jgi:hypothetical protein